jgi:hypothetical protein
MMIALVVITFNLAKNNDLIKLTQDDRTFLAFVTF